MLGAFLVLFMCARARAQQSVATFTWTAPQAYSDGTVLPPSDIWYYTFSWSGATAEPWLPYDSEQLAPDVVTASVPLLCGKYTVTLSVTTTLTAAKPFTTSMPAGPIVIDTGRPCSADVTYSSITVTVTP